MAGEVGSGLRETSAFIHDPKTALVGSSPYRVSCAASFAWFRRLPGVVQGRADELVGRPRE